jgi:hypothetical protein
MGGYMKDIATLVILAPTPALLGAAAYLHQSFNRHRRFTVCPVQ